MKKKTIAVAESCTGGLVGHLITNTPGSSDYFLGGIVAYSNDVKIDILGVPESLIKKHGAVSCETAREMAVGVRELLGADVGAAVTGIAGPSGGTKEKPVGCAFLAVAAGKKVTTKKVTLKGGRLELKRKFADAALDLIEACSGA